MEAYRKLMEYLDSGDLDSASFGIGCYLVASGSRRIRYGVLCSIFAVNERRLRRSISTLEKLGIIHREQTNGRWHIVVMGKNSTGQTTGQNPAFCRTKSGVLPDRSPDKSPDKTPDKNCNEDENYVCEIDKLDGCTTGQSAGQITGQEITVSPDTQGSVFKVQEESPQSPPLGGLSAPPPKKPKTNESMLDAVRAIYQARNDLYATLTGRRADQAPVNDRGEWTRSAKKLAASLKALSARGTDAYAVPSAFGALGDDGARDLWLAIVRHLAGDEWFRKNLRVYFNADTLWGVESKIGRRVGLVLAAGWHPPGRDAPGKQAEEESRSGRVFF